MFFKKLIPASLKARIKEETGYPSVVRTLKILKGSGFDPKLAVDGGAYEGEWTLEFLRIFPDANVLLIEPQYSKRDILSNLCNNNENLSLASELLSSTKEKKMSFIEDETISHIDLKRNDCLRVTTTLDELINDNYVVYPDIIKLDVQGHELEVLKGAENSLKHAEVCLLEVSFLDYGLNHPLFTEVLIFMDRNNFQVYDISHFIRENKRQALYQADIFFVKKNSNLINVDLW